MLPTLSYLLLSTARNVPSISGQIEVSEVSANSRNNVAGNEPPEGPISCPSWVSPTHHRVMMSEHFLQGDLFLRVAFRTGENQENFQ
ncbi:hypothetical protein CEXT_99091 [Caerostris extrusa]|uniref:Secreted protein n=1 Tax=Caerostris extrusa TaxID=172846 RepID=A0AAV4P0F6_CAEEX|nr:hypothetical protein CEXT_99091 [Caerostris extrusa]